MKKLFKTLVVLASVVALGFGFASCKNNDDDNGSGNGGTTSLLKEITGTTVAVYESEDFGKSAESYRLTFYTKDGKNLTCAGYWERDTQVESRSYWLDLSNKEGSFYEDDKAPRTFTIENTKFKGRKITGGCYNSRSFTSDFIRKSN